MRYSSFNPSFIRFFQLKLTVFFVSLLVGCGQANDVNLVEDSKDAISTVASGKTIIPDENIEQEAYIKASNTGSLDIFGATVAISGDTMVVGAPGENSSAPGVNGDESNDDFIESGAVYVYIRTGSTWTQQAYLKASNPGPIDRFGDAVAISGDTIVVGAPAENSSATGINGDESDESASNAGAAYVFTRRGGTWTQQAYLKASNTDSFDKFGTSVAIAGDTVVIGAPLEDSNATKINGDQSDNSAFGAGAAYVFERSGKTWKQRAYLKSSNLEAGDTFGSSVSISGSRIVVGAESEDSSATGVNGDRSDNSVAQSGAAYVFVRRNNSRWKEEAYLKASSVDESDLFGGAVDISGDIIVVGARFEDSGVINDPADNSIIGAGAAYVYSRSDLGWSLEAYLKPSDSEFIGNTGDGFGATVAIFGDTIVIGAGREDSSAIGVNGDEMDNSLLNSGAAYVFNKNGDSWSQRFFLKASNADEGDNFGGAVAISDDTIVIGAKLERSGDTGVDGDQNDNSLQSGAAYVFKQIQNSKPTKL